MRGSFLPSGPGCLNFTAGCSSIVGGVWGGGGTVRTWSNELQPLNRARELALTPATRQAGGVTARARSGLVNGGNQPLSSPRTRVHVFARLFDGWIVPPMQKSSLKKPGGECKLGARLWERRVGEGVQVNGMWETLCQSI